MAVICHGRGSDPQAELIALETGFCVEAGARMQSEDLVGKGHDVERLAHRWLLPRQACTNGCFHCMLHADMSTQMSVFVRRRRHRGRDQLSRAAYDFIPGEQGSRGCPHPLISPTAFHKLSTTSRSVPLGDQCNTTNERHSQDPSCHAYTQRVDGSKIECNNNGLANTNHSCLSHAHTWVCARSTFSPPARGRRLTARIRPLTHEPGSTIHTGRRCPGCSFGAAGYMSCE